MLITAMLQYSLLICASTLHICHAAGIGESNITWDSDIVARCQAAIDEAARNLHPAAAILFWMTLSPDNHWL